MTDFSKIKIPFALALLAALFTLRPIIIQYDKISYTLFGICITINFVYVILCVLLGASVYFYAIGLVGDKPLFNIANNVGHITYAIALIVPPFFTLLFIVSATIELLPSSVKIPTAIKIITATFSALIGIFASIVSSFIFKSFISKDRQSKIAILTDQENYLLNRARKLYTEGYFDICVTEAWKAIEIALNKTLLNIGETLKYRNMQKILDIARHREILNESQIQQLMTIRQVRNEAVHSDKKVTIEEAENALTISDKIIAILEKANDHCYYCGKTFPSTLIETDDITGASVCENCRKKNPNWKDELMAMGMDT